MKRNWAELGQWVSGSHLRFVGWHPATDRAASTLHLLVFRENRRALRRDRPSMSLVRALFKRARGVRERTAIQREIFAVSASRIARRSRVASADGNARRTSRLNVFELTVPHVFSFVTCVMPVSRPVARISHYRVISSQQTLARSQFLTAVVKLEYQVSSMKYRCETLVNSRVVE